MQENSELQKTATERIIQPHTKDSACEEGACRYCFDEPYVSGCDGCDSPNCGFHSPRKPDPRKHFYFRYIDLRRYHEDGTLDDDATMAAINASMDRSIKRILSKRVSKPMAQTHIYGPNRATKRQTIRELRKIAGVK